MNRTLMHQCFKATGPGPGEVLVATGFDHPVRGPVLCPAAPAVAGSLHRQGVHVRLGIVPVVSSPVPDMPPDDATILFCVTYLDRRGRAVGLGAAVAGAAASVGPGLGTAASEAVRTWASAMRTRRAVLAATDPSCPGERDALGRARAVLAAASRPVYIYGQLTRNPYVADDLRQHGAVFTDSLDQVPDGSAVLFAAHGVPLSIRAEAAARGLRIIDTTCPLVTAVHEKARSYAEQGDTIVVIGKPGHAVVPGIVGQAGVRFISKPDEVTTVDLGAPDRLSYLVQTGIPVEESAPVVAALRSRFPGLRGQHPDQFCYVASDRLGVIRRTAEVADVLIVAGAADCADSRQMLEAAVAAGAEAHLVETAADVRREWVERAGTVGLTAGLAARAGLTDEVLMILSGLGPLSVTRMTLSTDVITAARDYAVPVPSQANKKDPIWQLPGR